MTPETIILSLPDADDMELDVARRDALAQAPPGTFVIATRANPVQLSTRFEYRAENWPPEHIPGLTVGESYRSYLNQLGQEGWELATVTQGAAIYKRAVP